VPELWLIGGTGDIGTKVAARLAAADAGPVVLVSRSQDRAEAAAHSLGDPATRGQGIDSANASAVAQIPPGSAVLNLTEATSPAFAARVVAGGGSFVETSASADYIARLRSAVSAANGPGRAVFSVGLTPGLTNILAAELVARMPQAKALDIIVEMGMGRHHGLAATEWFLRNAGVDYPAIIDGTQALHAPARMRRRVRFTGDARTRLALGYGFSDQLVIAERLKLASVRTFTALEPAFATHGLGLAISAGLGGWIAHRAERVARWMSRGPVLGPSRTRLLMQALDGNVAPLASTELHTSDQSEVTAVMAALTLQKAATASQRGALEIDDLIGFDKVHETLMDALPETRVYKT